MKANIFLSLIGLFAAGAIASPTSAEAAAEAALVAECGDLGVMRVDVSQLPDGINPADVRRCADHPLGRSPSMAPASSSDLQERDTEDDLVSLKPRACYTKQTYGCDQGYCWKQCGLLNTGEWCWTATVAGLGTWASCNKDTDCSTLLSCGIGVCKACGCGC